jgi:hypothetical protein
LLINFLIFRGFNFFVNISFLPPPPPPPPVSPTAAEEGVPTFLISEKINYAYAITFAVCVCAWVSVYLPLSLLGSGSVKYPLIFARQRLGKKWAKIPSHQFV